LCGFVFNAKGLFEGEFASVGVTSEEGDGIGNGAGDIDVVIGDGEGKRTAEPGNAIDAFLVDFEKAECAAESLPLS